MIKTALLATFLLAQTTIPFTPGPQSRLTWEHEKVDTPTINGWRMCVDRAPDAPPEVCPLVPGLDIKNIPDTSRVEMSIPFPPLTPGVHRIEVYAYNHRGVSAQSDSDATPSNSWLTVELFFRVVAPKNLRSR